MSERLLSTKMIIDTNVFLFFINKDKKLSSTAKKVLESEVDLLISIVSLWEIAIKVSLGKLELPTPYEQFIPSQLELNQIDVMPISSDELTLVSKLPFYHKDPFDRIIIAQAISNNLPVVSSDEEFVNYGVERIW